MGGEPVVVGHSCFGFTLLAPESIAGSVKKDEPSFGIGIGQHWVGLTANRARFRRRSPNDYPRHPHRGAGESAVCRWRDGWQFAGGYKLANPGAQRIVVHTAPDSKKETTERLAILMQGWTGPRSARASNRQETRHSGLQPVLDAEQPDKLLAHLSRCADDRDEPHPLPFIRDGD